jgi:hypothetical protein
LSRESRFFGLLGQMEEISLAPQAVES